MELLVHRHGVSCQHPLQLMALPTLWFLEAKVRLDREPVGISSNTKLLSIGVL